MAVKLRIDEGLFKVDLAKWERYVSWSPGAPYFNLPPGREHYKLINYLTNQLPPNSAVADCGTLFGCSAVALAASSAFVFTYDTVDHITSRAHLVKNEGTMWDFPNIQPVLSSCMEHVEQISTFSLVMLDIDPHDGKEERQFVKELSKGGFRGILLCDDIHLNEEMKDFWKALNGIGWVGEPEFKTLDLTKWGHWSGTGAVVFSPETIDLEVMF